MKKGRKKSQLLRNWGCLNDIILIMEDQFLKVAKEAALEAGKVIQSYSNKFGEKIIKYGDKSDFVTKADLESEKVIVEILTRNFPEHSVIAEEGGGSDKKSEFVWMVDPLDGTFAFVHKIPYYTVSIGLLKDGKPIVGVINHIVFKDLYWAQAGKGSFLNGNKTHVSNTQTLEEAASVLGTGHIQKRQKKIELYINKLIKRIGHPFDFGSAAANLALLARGTLDLYVAQAYLWDFAAGAVIVREAGGKVTNFEGNEPEWTKDRLNIVASNGLVHEQILEALKK